MRTIRVAITTGSGLMSDTTIESSTEVLVGDDREAEDMGEAAMEVLLAFTKGMAKVRPDEL